MAKKPETQGIETYVVLRPITFPPGLVLRLTAEQAAVRRHNLVAVGDNLYKGRTELQFAVGEVIGTPHNLPPLYTDRLTQVVPAAPAEADHVTHA